MFDSLSNPPLGFGLDRVADMLKHLQSPTLAVHRRQCTRVRHRRSTCARCADACPTHAITRQGSLQVEWPKCNDCGICATVCPTGALEAQAPTNAELVERINRHVAVNEAVAFACSRFLDTTHASSARAIQVQCLGRLDESILFATVAGGAQPVTLLDGACADCPHAIGRSIAERVVQRTNALLAAFGSSRPIVFDERRLALAEPLPNSSTTSDSLSRRAFFDCLRREAVKATAVTVNSVLSGQVTPADMDERLPRGELPTRVPAKHGLLLTALRKIGEPAMTEWSDGIWAQYGITGKCDGCQMCAFFCPTGALTKIEQEGKLGVAFNLALCIDCRLCQEICYLDAVTLAPMLDLDNVVKDEVETFLMADAASSVWKLSPEERLKRNLT